MALFNFWKRLFQNGTVEKRKKYRYTIPSEISAQLELILPSQEKISMKVLNLNEEAVAVSYEQGLEISLFEVSHCRARMILGDITFDFEAELLRYAEGYLVFRYQNFEPADQQNLLNFFPVILGHSLERREVLQPYSQWIHGMNYTDIFIQREDREPHKIYNLTYVSEDHFYHWNDEGGCQTGVVKRQIYSEGFGFSKREQNPVAMDPAPDPQKITRLMQIIESSSLSPPLGQEILAILHEHR